MTVLQILYADTFGSHIGKHSERLMYTQGKTTLAQAPLMHLQEVVIASRGVSISADAIEECCDRGIPIYMIDGLGTPYAAIYSPGLMGTVLTRRQQLTAYYDGRGVEIGIAIAAAKINNQVATLKYVAKFRKESDPAAYELLRDAAADAAAQADKLNGLRGMSLDDLRVYLMAFEANAAVHYWGALRTIIPEHYGWTARITRGATDPVNSLLNYGYGFLRLRVERALHLAGLDMFGGYIHADRPGKQSLALDMMEEWRTIAVDRLVIGLINRNYIIEMNDFGMLEEDVKRSFAKKLREQMEAVVRVGEDKVAIGIMIQKQARKLAAHLRGETTAYLPYRATW
ncbi:MAG: CRISPR-associated endonuclease Cas1 [Chloroflexota bacterium]|nr:CRISPR-associated endonuclease Cas1 [Chloroflexota bacterium]